MSFCIKLGFFNAEEFASLSLKCVPCFLSWRKWANFFSVAGGGDPGGEGGISKFGTDGIVRSRNNARLAE